MPNCYVTPEDCESPLGKRMQAFRADRPSEWLMDDFIRDVEAMHAEVEALREDKAMLEQIRRNVRRVEQSSDMSVTVTMSSCRMAGELIQAIDAAREDA